MEAVKVRAPRRIVASVVAGALLFGSGVFFGRAQTSGEDVAAEIHSQVRSSVAFGTAHAGPSHAVSAHEAMDRKHEARVKAFPAKTKGQGAQLMQPRVVDGVKIFELTATAVKWETEPGRVLDGLAYNNQIPGPTIRVTEGDRVRVILRNRFGESTAIHFHGLIVPNSQDGVPYVTQPIVKPGAQWTYEFTAGPVGSHMYHAHNGDDQITRGLLGAFLVDPKDKSGEPQVAADVVMVLNDGPLGYTLNGKGFPATSPLVVKVGDTVRVRFMNEGSIIHPMHQHGFPMKVIAKDGYALPQPYTVDTLNVAPGERYDVLITPTMEGLWAHHCHILSHAESSEGMHGMVTVLIAKK
jgi:FtsP/CotA-like multicopper oxidase with cupredoxin domain